MIQDNEAIESAHVLVVDDNEVNRDLLARRLRREKHTVEFACDGQQALDALLAKTFDLVLLDIMMPVMNGHELLQKLKVHETLRHVPVILISALDDAENIARGIELGADDHLPKPFNPAILHARVSASLARKRLRDREQLYARSLEREMDIARDIQAGFLPPALPQVDGWELASHFQPARRVGGDFYDAFALPGQRIALVVADVCDKGVGAALFMAVFRSLIRALAERTFSADSDPGEEVRKLILSVNNYTAHTHGDANMFATVFMGILDPASGDLAYVNAGHEAPLLCTASGIRAHLQPNGPAMGLMPDMPFQASAIIINPGETLVIVTDGITDARDPNNASFGDARLLALLEQPAQSAHATRDAIGNAVQAHAQGAPPFDDTTLLVIHRHA